MLSKISVDPPRRHPAYLRVPVAVSAAHVHLTPPAIEELFCDKYRLHEYFRTAQPAQYAARESVTLIGPHGRLSNVRVIGPPRSANQVEISRTNALTLGIDAPVRESGDLAGTPGVLIQGPRACIRIERGVIRGLPHIHMSPADADCLGFKDRDRITVTSEIQRGRILFRDVLVHVSADCRLELHLDADQGDTAGLRSGDFVVVRTPA
jgi:propanediol utilization protein